MAPDPLRCPLEHLDHPPPLVLGERTGLGDQHLVSHMGRVPLVVNLEASGLPNHTLVLGVADKPLHRNHTTLVHLVGDYTPHPRFATGLGHSHSYLADPVRSSRSRRVLKARARSRRAMRILRGFLAILWESWNRKLKISSRRAVAA